MTSEIQCYHATARQAPVVGRWSDAYGRKRFMLLSLGCSAAQIVALLLYITRGTSLFWFFPAQARLGNKPCHWVPACLVTHTHTHLHSLS
jgi:MFS family permease